MMMLNALFSLLLLISLLSPFLFASNNVGFVSAFAPATEISFRRASSFSTSFSNSALQTTAADKKDIDIIPTNLFENVGFVLLAGGKGSRMKADMPKQFLELKGKPILKHSLELFLDELPQACGGTHKCCVALVLDPMYQPEYAYLKDKYPNRFVFANPGEERQGSVENGLDALVNLTNSDVQFVAIHDSARPLVTIKEIWHVVQDAKEVGAAVLGVPCKATIKESADGSTVLRTIPRARLWEVHTPQVVRVETLLKGFKKVREENLEVTDDVSIVEALGEPVKLTLGEYTNLKITTPEDMDVAAAILTERANAKAKV
jgi:2-C-methyl-D-erythritol 4-phosphate cytidylyltransferase